MNNSPVILLLIISLIQLVFFNLAKYIQKIIEISGNTLWGNEPIGIASAWIFGFTMLWFSQIIILWAAWRFYFKPSIARQRIYGVSYLNCVQWLMCLLYFPAATLYFSAVGFRGYFDHATELESMSHGMFILGEIITISGAGLALVNVYDILGELLSEIFNFWKLRKVLNAPYAREIKKIAVHDSLLDKEFADIFKNRVGQSFFAIGIQYGEWLILLDRLGDTVIENTISRAVNEIADHCAAAFGGLQTIFPGIQFKVVYVHTYCGNLSSEDRRALRQFANSISICVQGLKLDALDQQDLQFGSRAIQVAATEVGDDEHIPLHLMSEFQVSDFNGPFAKKLITAIKKAIAEKNKEM